MDNTVFMFYLIVALLLAVSIATAVFYAYRAVTFGRNPPHKAVLVSSLAALPAWFVLGIALALGVDVVREFAVQWFAGNGWVFAAFFALALMALQYRLLDYFYQRS